MTNGFYKIQTHRTNHTLSCLMVRKNNIIERIKYYETLLQLLKIAKKTDNVSLSRTKRDIDRLNFELQKIDDTILKLSIKIYYYTSMQDHSEKEISDAEEIAYTMQRNTEVTKNYMTRISNLLKSYTH